MRFHDGQDTSRNTPHGALTTVDVPIDQMNRRAAELLASRFTQPNQPVRRLFLGCSLFRGDTTRPAAPTNGKTEKSS